MTSDHNFQEIVYAEVLFPFEPVGDQELALEKGALVEVIRRDPGPWWWGQIKHDEIIASIISEQSQGWFPKDFVRVSILCVMTTILVLKSDFRFRSFRHFQSLS